MSSCPYCGGAHLSAATPIRERPSTQTLVQCSSCMDFSVKHDSGRVYPLTNRKDPEADACTRVIDN